MSELKTVYDNEDDIPESVENFRELFVEKNGKFELTGISGIQTPANVARLQTGLEKERDAHKATKERLKVWGDMDHEDVVSKLDRIPELEAAAKGKLDDQAIEEIVQRRLDGTLKSKLGPIERENTKLKRERDEFAEKIGTFEQRETRRSIRDETGKALLAAKVIPEAHEDALFLAERLMEVTEDGNVITKDGNGVPPGLHPADWLTEIQDKKPHWWPPAVGGGARGSRGGTTFGGPNPWSADGWNMTAQGQYVRAHGTEKASRLAEAAGTKIGGERPKAKA